MRRRFRAAGTWSVALVFVVSTALLSALPASANHAWGNYHWARTSNPFTLKLGDNLTSNWKPHLGTTSTDWSKSTVLDTTIVAGGTSARRCRPTVGRVEVCNAAYGNTGWLGLAQIWASGSHITQGVAKMNDTYFNLPQYNTPAERNHVMCQEVGHTFGLGHQDESGASLGTCMDYANDSTNSQHPNQHDYDMLLAIYAHLDSTTTVGASVGAMPAEVAEADVDTPVQWGQQMHASGRAAIYVREFAGGHTIITVVTWAESERSKGR